MFGVKSSVKSYLLLLKVAFWVDRGPLFSILLPRFKCLSLCSKLCVVKLLPPIQSFDWIFLIISSTCFCQKTARSKTFLTSILCSHSCKISQTVFFASISPFHELSLYFLAISSTLSINIPFYNAIYITRFIYLAFSTRLNSVKYISFNT